MTPLSKPYGDVVDEWISWQKNTNKPMPLADYAKFMDSREGGSMRQSAYQPDVVQRITDTAQRFADNPRAVTETALGMLDPTQVTRMAFGPLTAQLPTQLNLAAGTGEMGAGAGRTIDQLLPEGGLRNPFKLTNPLTTKLPQEGSGNDWEQNLRGLGESIPSMATTAPLLFTPAGLPLAVAKTMAEAYTPHADPVSGLIAGTGMAMFPAVQKAGGSIAEKAAMDFLLPSAERMAAQAPAEFGQAVSQGLQTAVASSTPKILAASKFGGQVVGGTSVMEGQRQAESLNQTGELASITPASLTASLGLNLVGAGELGKTLMSARRSGVTTFDAAGNPIFGAESAPLVAEVMDRAYRAQGMRNAASAKTAEYNAARGQRIADSHAEIFRATEAGQDATESIGKLRAHWEEVTTQSPDYGLRLMKSFSEEANTSGVPDEAFHRIVAGVQGRYADHFKADPSLPGPETVNELVKRGLLPKITKEWIGENFRDATDMMLGDYEGAKALLVNRITAHYEERLPGALEAMKAQKVPEGLSRQELNAKSEADKDALYIQSLIKLYPHMKDARVVAATVDDKGNAKEQRLAEAMWQRDMELSAQTQGEQLSTSSTAWSKYDAWKDAIIKMAETYDPTTRRGTFLPIKRMSDGTVLELPAQQTSLEDMVQKKEGKYTFNVTPTRKMQRAGSSSALRDAVEFVNEKFRPTEQVEEDIQNVSDPEKFLAERRQMIRSTADEELTVEETAGIEADADSVGLVGKDREEFIVQQTENMKSVDNPALGVDLAATNKEPFYDVALHLMNKVDRLTNAELWDKYGGERLFGKGAKSPGKFQLFKDALLARMESEMDDSGQLSVAQKKFYNAWSANRDVKLGTAIPLGKTWEEQRAQFRHALRLYWGSSSPVSMPDLFMSMLEDKPKYQQMLQGVKGKSAKSRAETNFELPLTVRGGRLGDPSGLFYGTNVTKSDAKNPERYTEKEFPTKGKDVLTIQDHWLQNEGDGSNAPLTELLHNGLMSLDKDLYELVKGKEGLEQPLDTDLLAAVQLKRDGYNLIHLVDPENQKNVVSVDLRHTTEAQLIQRLKSQLREPSEFHDMERFAHELFTVRQSNFSKSASGTDIDATPANSYLSGFSTPLVDALRIGEGFGKRIGLPPEDAHELGVTTAMAVQAFPDVEAFGKLKTPDTTTMGVHVYEDRLIKGQAVAINLDAIDARERTQMQKAIKFLSTVAHEMAHTDVTVGPLAQQRMDAAAKLQALIEGIGPEASSELFNEILPQVLLPDTLRPKTVPSLASDNFGQEFKAEGMSRFLEHVMLGVLTKTNPWSTQNQRQAQTWGEAVQWLPDEVQASIHLGLRDLSNVLGAVEAYYGSRPQQPNDKLVMATLRPMLVFAKEYLATNVQKLHEARDVAERMSTLLTASGALGDLGEPTLLQSAQSLDSRAVMRLSNETKYAMSVSPEDKEAVKETQATMFGGKKTNRLITEAERRLGVQIPPWSHWLGLSYQAMLRFHKEGNPLAETIMYKVNDLEKAYFRLNRLMHDPFMVYDEKGRLTYDTSHPLLRILHRSDPAAIRARVAVSDMARWANEQGKPVITKDQSGQTILSPDVPADLRAKIGKFAPEDQQGILKGMESLLQGTQHAADIQFHDRVEDVGSRLGGVLMAVDRGMYSEAAFSKGKQITVTAMALKAAQNQIKRGDKEPLLVPELKQAVNNAQQQFYATMQGLNGDQIGAVQAYLFGKDGLAQGLIDLREFFTQRKDWFTTESRPGRIFIMSKLPGPEMQNHYTSAENMRLAQKVSNELVAQGHTNVRALDRQQQNERDMFDTPDAIVNNLIEIEKKAWADARANMEQHVDPEALKFIDSLGYVPGEATEKMLSNKAISRYMKTRELTPGRELLDSIDAFRDYTGRLSGTVARRGLTREMALLMRDPRLRNQDEFKNFVQTMTQSLLQPLNGNLQVVRTALTARYLGLPQLVSPFIEMTQSAAGVLPYLIDQVGFSRGVDTYRKALVAPGLLMKNKNSLAFKRTLQRATEKENVDPRAMTKEESMALYYDRQGREGGFQQGAIYSPNSKNHDILTQQAFGLGASKPRTREQMLLDPLYWASQMSMSLYSQATGYNSRVAFLGALDILYDRGLRGHELYQGAAAYQNLYTHGGGKANAIGYVSKLSNPLTRSAWGLTETLQRYVFGNTTMQKDLADEMIGRIKGVTPAQRVKATEAFMTAQFIQFILGGAMGLTGMGIGSAVIKSMTGWDAKQKLREFWVNLYDRLGADDPLAVQLANYSQNGFISNSLGVDVSNRVTMNSMLGFNEYDGFNTNEITGVLSSVVEDLWDATKFVGQGNMTKAGKALAPPALRPYIDLGASKSKFGTFALRDTQDRMLTPLTNAEAVGTAVGLKPYRNRLIRDQQQAMKASADGYQLTKDQKLDDLAQELLRGNTKGMMELLQQQRAVDPTIMPQATVRSVIDRAVDTTRPMDPLASGPTGNDARQREIAASFGNVTPRQSELQDLMTRTKLNAQTGFMGGPPPDKRAVERAVLIDALVQKQGVTKAEAARLVGLMGY